MAKVSMKFGSQTMASHPLGSGGQRGGSSSADPDSSAKALNLESVHSFSQMTDYEKIYLYAKNHLGRFINEVNAEIVEGELPSGYDKKNTFYFIQDVEEEEE